MASVCAIDSCVSNRVPSKSNMTSLIEAGMTKEKNQDESSNVPVALIHKVTSMLLLRFFFKALGVFWDSSTE